MFGRERRSTDSISPQGPASERIQREAASRSVEAAMTDELPFKVVRINSTYEVLARAANLMIARGAIGKLRGCTPTTRSCSTGARG
jgi:hypothetical protein